jgi:outer membrane murein-binding lipoprotein Lpp
MPAEQDKVATLRQAAAAKREAAVARAETGIRKLTKTGQPVTFRGVAAASGVSVDFLYRHPELRARIERLRGHQPAPAGRAPASQPGNPGASSVVATLTARLTELRRELAETKAQLAAAHGELLALRRHPGNAARGDGSSRPPSATTPR